MSIFSFTIIDSVNTIKKIMLLDDKLYTYLLIAFLLHGYKFVSLKYLHAPAFPEQFRKSAPFSNKCVAKEWRNVCGVIFFLSLPLKQIFFQNFPEPLSC